MACSSLILLKEGFYSWDPNFYETISLCSSAAAAAEAYRKKYDYVIRGWCLLPFLKSAFKQCWNIIIFIRNKEWPSKFGIEYWAIIRNLIKKANFAKKEKKCRGCVISADLSAIFLRSTWPILNQNSFKTLRSVGPSALPCSVLDELWNTAQYFVSNPVLVFSWYWKFCFAQDFQRYKEGTE